MESFEKALDSPGANGNSLTCTQGHIKCGIKWWKQRDQKNQEL